jgi:preprotein translocase subunit SecD
VLLKPVSDEEVTNQQIQDLIAVLSNRLNVYGVSDIKIRPANDIVGNKFVLVEIAAVSKEEVRDLIAQQGKFEAKIGDEVAFIGGERDVTFVCRNDGSCSGIRPPCVPNQNGYSCTFQFAITITEEAAERHAEITKNMGINTSASGSPYLEKTIDLYLDDKLVDSLNIGADLKGKALTQIAISGPGYGATEEAAYDDAIKNMNRLQTILITGSLPFKLEIAKLDTISPALGEEFLSNSILVGIVALIAVAAVIVIRYRQLKVIIPIIIISVSEVLITLGVAALIGWNMDMASIAGIIAAVGTGVNDQILITDEVLRGQGEKFATWKEKFKRAFSIILAAYLTLIAAMLPLWNAGAGLVRGFAVTTIIGVTIGVFITRPAFASMIESLLEK